MKDLHEKTKLGKFLVGLKDAGLDVLDGLKAGKDPISAILGAVTGGNLSQEQANTALLMHNQDLLDVQQTRTQNVQIQISKESSFLAKNTPYILIFLLFGLMCYIINALFVSTIPVKNESTLYLMLGSISTAFIGGCTFVHGSSHGSQQKDRAAIDKIREDRQRERELEAEEARRREEERLRKEEE